MNYMKQYNVALSRFTTIKIGGIADVLYSPLNKEGIVQSFEEIKREGKPFFVLGGGSNVVIQDGKLPYAVVCSTRLTHYRFNENCFEAQAGLSSNNVSELAANHNLSGLEFCFGLPGSIGGAVFMNAKAFGSEMADLVEEVEVYDYEKEEFLILGRNDFDFGYKKSVFQNKPYFIFKIKMILSTEKSSAIWRKMEEAKHTRSENGHYHNPSAGCAFKNNYEQGISSGKLIDELGLKGFKVGGVKVSESHANFLVNNGGGSYDDYKTLLKSIQNKVMEERNIKLEPEVRFLP